MSKTLPTVAAVENTPLTDSECVHLRHLAEAAAVPHAVDNSYAPDRESPSYHQYAREYERMVQEKFHKVNPFEQALTPAVVLRLLNMLGDADTAAIALQHKLDAAQAKLLTIRTMATRGVPNCINLEAIDRIIGEEVKDFQARVAVWMHETFGAEVSSDFRERGFRFGEEAIELLQANGTTKDEVLLLVDYVYGRPVGELRQEVGGTMLTLGALCQARNINLAGAAYEEMARCEQPAVRAKIQAKQEAKRARMIASPLPGLPIVAELVEEPMPEQTDGIIQIRSYRFQYGILHLEKAAADSMTDAEVAEEYYIKGPLLEAWYDQMDQKEFFDLEDFRDL